jgi:hypothetical protein
MTVFHVYDSVVVIEKKRRDPPAHVIIPLAKAYRGCREDGPTLEGPAIGPNLVTASRLLALWGYIGDMQRFTKILVLPRNQTNSKKSALPFSVTRN